jgi:GNAT superfamily N-acetyltransferase
VSADEVTPGSLPAVRVATEQDLPAVLALYAQPELDDGLTVSPDHARAIFARFARHPFYRLYVAEIAAQVVGTFTLLVAENLSHHGVPSAVVESIAVAPPWQGRGIGRAMMAEAMRLAREAGCYKLALSSNRRRERAHRFYESLGFGRHGYSFAVEL